ncbi:MAG TPA: sigma-70 family RNA polymerase sigma factor [Polyangiaceae bacterium]|nr:sigma-70 family RNA polymerase sigma factor [Polyangiaceae bacterium]
MIDPAVKDDFGALSARLRDFVGRRVERAAVDDLVQDILLRVHNGLPALRDEERFGPWLYRVARSAIIDHRRDRGRRSLANGYTSKLATGESDVEENEALESACAVSLARFVEALSSPYREAVTLTELEGLSQRDTALRLGASLAATKSRVQRGRALLRAAFEKCCVVTLDARGGLIRCEQRGTGCQRR